MVSVLGLCPSLGRGGPLRQILESLENRKPQKDLSQGPCKFALLLPGTMQERARRIGTKLTQAVLVLFLLAVPAAAAPACVIVVANDRASTTEIYQHEIAHCNGWVHADQGHDGKPEKGYKSPKPPARFIREYPGKVVDHWVSTDEALRICGSYGCQWFE